MAQRIAKVIKLQWLQVKVISMNAVRKLCCAFTMLGVFAIIEAATIVQEAKELNYQQVCFTNLPNVLAMV
jgi:hypothetical protein